MKPPLPTTSPTYRPGTMIAGKYRIEGTLAVGGIGVIVAAEHVGLSQRVAIKYLKPAVLSTAAVVERFEREARVVARLRSEHVVRVLDVGSIPGAGPYMVMEYLEGRDLGTVLRDGPLPLQGAVDCLLQTCDAIAEAHANGIVHRDLKPENLFLAKRSGGAPPVVKVLDFGISKLTPKAQRLERESRSTEFGETFGTPVYMSPEQLRASTNVDARADVWSLGVVLFELLANEMPFEGDTLPHLVTSIVSDPPKTLRDRVPHVPPGLEAIIMRCLQKDRDARYPNVAELATALVPFGPPGSAERVARIKGVLREAGESVRSEIPPPSTLSPPAVPVPPAPLLPRSLRPLARARTWVIAAALGVTVALAAFVRHRASPVVATASSIASPESAPASGAAGAAPAASDGVPVESLPSAVPVASSSASAGARRPAHSAGARPVGRPPDDYSAFGGRK